MRKSLLMAALAAAFPFYMSDEAGSAASGDAPNASASAAEGDPASGTTQSATTATTDSATGTTAEVAGEAGNGEPGAAASTGATGSSAVSNGNAPVLAEVPAADSVAALAGDTSSLHTDANGTVIEPLAAAGDTVNVPAGSHAEAKDRFAGVLAKLHQFEENLHQFEDEALNELRTNLIAIGTLLHLHSKASTTAQTTGDYKAGDLS